MVKPRCHCGGNAASKASSAAVVLLVLATTAAVMVQVCEAGAVLQELEKETDGWGQERNY